MKTLQRLFVALGLLACIASARAELSPVSLGLGRQQFQPGDAIVVDQVLSNSATLEVGATVVVRGHYTLSSTDVAKIGLFVTHRVPAGPEETTTGQMKRIERRNGVFELTCEIHTGGDIHVSFYPATGGESFGGVYFAVATQKS